MRTRAILIAILLATLAGVAALSVVSKGHAIEFQLPFGVLSILIFGLAILRKRLAWAIAFVISVFGCGMGIAFAITASRDQAYGWLGAVLYGIAALALWGLNPDAEPDRSKGEEAAQRPV